MAEKIDADEFRQMSVKQIQRTINDQKLEKKKVVSEELGSGNPTQASQSIGTIKRNIARAKTIINEKMRQNN